MDMGYDLGRRYNRKMGQMRFVNGLDVGHAREERSIIPKYCPEQLGKWYYFGDRQALLEERAYGEGGGN